MIVTIRYESLPDVQQSFNSVSSPSHSLKKKSECNEDEYVDMQNERAKNEYGTISD